MQNNNLIWKVCGMRDPANIRQVAMLRPDMMGFIFYRQSPRFAGDMLSEEVINHLGGIQKTGVFVNQDTREIMEKVNRYALDFVQLHGDEPVSQAKELSGEVKVIKVVPGNSLPEKSILEQYEDYITYWLTDTRTATRHGGTGQVFDWSQLNGLGLRRGIILSGGIGAKEVKDLLKDTPDGIIGIDVNSKAEAAPGIKNIEQLKRIQDELFS